MTEIIEQIEEMTDDELRTLVKTIHELLEDRKEVPEVHEGDLVKFEIRDGINVTGTVSSITKKRCKVKLHEAEGEVGVNLSSIEVLYSAPQEEPVNIGISELEGLVEGLEATEDPLLRNSPDDFHLP